MNNISLIFIPLLILFVLIYSFIKRNNAYNSFIKGTKEGLSLFKEVFPSVCAMLLAVTLLKNCGVISDLQNILSKYFPYSNLFSDLFPMVIFRPISGSASVALLDQICSGGGDSLSCKVASTIQGSTDTTIYVLSLYFTSVGITKWKHALPVGLLADALGITSGILLAVIFLQ